MAICCRIAEVIEQPRDPPIHAPRLTRRERAFQLGADAGEHLRGRERAAVRDHAARVADVERAQPARPRQPCDPRASLLFTVEPGLLIRAELVEWCGAHLPALEVVPLGGGLHYIQEDHPHAIGRELADWIRRHRG